MKKSLLEVSSLDLSIENRSSSDNSGKAGERTPLLKDISFQIKKGGLYCLMGANGCGKTTLINCILGQLRQEKGSILINGRDSRSLKPRELANNISFVPQAHEKTFPYTVEQIVLMGRSSHSGALTGPGRDELRIVSSVLERVGISHLARRPYTQISGGEMQLVMLARALAQDTPLIIMDEPSAHLDFRNELVFMETVAELVKKDGKAVLMATHSPNHPFFFERNGLDVTVLAIADKRLMYEGGVSEVLTEERIKEIYSVDARIMSDGDLRQIIPVKTL